MSRELFDMRALSEWSDAVLHEAGQIYDDGREYVISLMPEKELSPEEMDGWKQNIEELGGEVRSMEGRKIAPEEEESELGDYILDIALTLPLLHPVGRVAGLIGKGAMAATRAVGIGTKAIKAGTGGAAVGVVAAKGATAVNAVRKTAPTVADGTKSVLKAGAVFAGATAVANVAAADGSIGKPIKEAGGAIRETTNLIKTGGITVLGLIAIWKLRRWII